MHRKLSIGCLLLAWLCAHGAIWNAVQVIGWVKMFNTYAQVMPTAQALQATFDGSAPCDFCEIAQAGQQATRDPKVPANPATGAEKVLLIAEIIPPHWLESPEMAWPGVRPDAGLTRTESVPVPPPRV